MLITTRCAGDFKLCSGVRMWLSVSDWSLWEIVSTTKVRLTSSLSASPGGAAECRQPRQTLAGCLKSTGLDSGALTAEWAQWIIKHGTSQRLWSPACHIMLHQITFWERACFFFFYCYITFRSDLMVAVAATVKCVHPSRRIRSFQLCQPLIHQREIRANFSTFSRRCVWVLVVSLCSYEIVCWPCLVKKISVSGHKRTRTQDGKSL